MFDLELQLGREALTLEVIDERLGQVAVAAEVLPVEVVPTDDSLADVVMHISDALHLGDRAVGAGEDERLNLPRTILHDTVLVILELLCLGWSLGQEGCGLGEDGGLAVARAIDHPAERAGERLLLVGFELNDCHSYASSLSSLKSSSSKRSSLVMSAILRKYSRVTLSAFREFFLQPA